MGGAQGTDKLVKNRELPRNEDVAEMDLHEAVKKKKRITWGIAVISGRRNKKGRKLYY